MALKDWHKAMVAPDATMHDAMMVLQKVALQIVLVVDADKALLGVITDGDIRRALLGGMSMETPVSEFMVTNPIYGTPEDSRDMLLGQMRTHGLHHMPVLDNRGVLLDLVTREPMQSRNNWVVIMAGGLGARLRPLTDDIPKPMLRIGDRPILETIISQLHEFGFHHFFISLNYLAEQIESYFGDGSRWGTTINYLREDAPLGTAGALAQIKGKTDLPVVVMNGDLLTKLNFDRLLEFHKEHAAPMTVCVREYTYSVPYGVLETDGAYMKSLAEKPKRQEMVNAGIYVIEPDVLNAIPDDAHIDITNIIEQLLADGKKPAVFPVHEYWIDIGQKHDIERAMEEFSEIFDPDQGP